MSPHGEVPEWSNGTVSKTVVRVTVPWVRIPPSPPISKTSLAFWLAKGCSRPDMELVKRRIDGLYVLERYDWLDEEVRDRFLELKALEQLMVTLGSLMPKSKTQNWL